MKYCRTTHDVVEPQDKGERKKQDAEVYSSSVIPFT